MTPSISELTDEIYSLLTEHTPLSSPGLYKEKMNRGGIARIEELQLIPGQQCGTRCSIRDCLHHTRCILHMRRARISAGWPKGSSQSQVQVWGKQNPHTESLR